MRDEFALDTRFIGALQGKDKAVLVGSTSGQSIFNRWLEDTSRHPNDQLQLSPFSSGKNHLVFVRSTLGRSYYDRGKLVGVYQLEPEILRAGTMAGLGRYLLLQVLNPTGDARLVLSVSDTLKADGHNLLPPASVYGAGAARFPLLGRGSARVLGPIMKPRNIEGAWFYLIDFGTDGIHFRVPRRGLMNWYGKDLNVDSRYLTCFARDISLVSERVIAETPPPSLVSKFPDDLLRNSVFYSGYYEDGWISDKTTIRLTSSLEKRVLRVSGTIPLVRDPDFSTTVTVRIDGVPVLRRALRVGDFDLRVNTISSGHLPHVVGLTFTHLQQLPGSDRRPVAALLKLIGFTVS